MQLKVLFTICSLCLAATSSFVCGTADAEGLVTNAKLTPDHRRLIITYDGRIETPEVFTLQSPARIVVDLPSADLGSIDRKKSFPGKRLQELRAGMYKGSARFVLDFGRYAPPEYKLRTIGEYVIVFLGKPGPPVAVSQSKERRPQPAAARSRPPQAARPSKRPHRADKPVVRKPLSQTRSVALKANTYPPTSGPLFVKCAKVMDGKLIVDVARKGNATKGYRINLDVDWKRIGFKSADIRKVFAGAPSPRKSSKGPTRAPGNMPSEPPDIKCVAKPCGFSPAGEK